MEKNKTCKTYENFIGGGDWNLCCKNPPQDNEPFGFDWGGFLCYEETQACENYKEKENDR